MKIGVIGLGQMANALIAGVLRGKLVEPADITGSCPSEETRKAVQEKTQINVTEQNVEAAKAADIVILAVPAAELGKVLDEIRPVINNGKIVLSVAQSGSLDWLDRELSGDGVVGFDLNDDKERNADRIPIVRALPNTPVLVGAGMTVFCPNEHVSEEQLATVTKLLKCCGEAQMVPEQMFPVIGTLTGTAPAIVCMMIEAMADAAASSGIPREAAYSFAAQTVAGSASMVLATGMHPGQIRDMVCTPESGRTEAVRVLEQTGFRSSVLESLKAVEQFQKMTSSAVEKK